MYARFKALPLWGQIVASVVIQIVVGIVKLLIPLVIIAAVIVGALWLFDKVRD
ncbi:MAG: hypothetical protein K8S97_13080 [Anaerolineae bacterium]|nr:hypothetical protein [Anaerolineae bacterium]